MKRRQTRTKTIPFKLLVCLLYGDYSWLSRAGLRFDVHVSGAARTLRISVARARDYFYWLAAQDYITIIFDEDGILTAALRAPRPWERISNTSGSTTTSSAASGEPS